MTSKHVFLHKKNLIQACRYLYVTHLSFASYKLHGRNGIMNRKKVLKKHLTFKLNSEICVKWFCL